MEHLSREHLEEVRRQREAEVDRTLKAVRERLISEILYWDSRAAEEERKAQAGKVAAKARAEAARRRAEELRERLRRREEELLRAKHIRSLPPRLSQIIWVIPPLAESPLAPEEEARRKLERLAVEAVLRLERRWGMSPGRCRRAGPVTMWSPASPMGP